MLSAKALLSTLSGVRSLLVLLIALLASASTFAQTPPIFPVPTVYTLTNYAGTPLVAGDFNGDGQPDLAYFSDEGGVAVRLNQGSTITSATPLSCPATTLIAADM